MNKKFNKENYILNIEKKLFFIFFIFTLLIIIAILKINSIHNNIGFNDKKIYSKDKINTYPNMYSRNKILIATSFNYYSLYLDKRKIKMDFLKIYLNNIEKKLNIKIDEDNIYKSFFTKNRNKILSNMNVHDVRKILELNKKFIKNGFFKKIHSKNGKYYFYGIEYIKNKKETRVYNNQYFSLLQPLLGKYNFKNIPTSGLEKYFFQHYHQETLNIFKRDAFNNIMYRKNYTKPENTDINLSIDLKLTENIQKLILKMNEKLQASNIVVAVAKTKTGELLSVNQLHHYITDINNNKTIYYKNDFFQFFYEPGSIFKPITLAIALEYKKVLDLNEMIDVNYGKLRIGHKIITDDEKDKKELSIKEIIAHSSNVGASKIALRFNNGEFLDGLNKMYFFKKPNIEYNVSKKNIFNSSVKKAIRNNKLIQRATASFGYGFLVSPYNMLELYNIIGNNGVYIPLTFLKKNKKNVKGIKILKDSTIIKLNEALRNVVEEGTGVGAKMKSIITSGKTGTAHIVEHGQYINKHNSTFVGFAQDKKGQKYTIYVLVSKPIWKYHFASLSAVPIFKKVTKILVKNNYLIPNI